MGELRVLIVDDHILFRDGLRALLTSLPGVTVVGEAENGLQAVERALELKPEIVFMDLQMPQLSGLDAIRRITDADQKVGVIAITMFDNDTAVFSAMQSGARGYVVKGGTQEEIVHALWAVAGGEVVLGKALARRVQSYFKALAPRLAAFALPELTEREREVLDLMARGLNNDEIERSLHISPKTVRNHVSNIYDKLQVASRTDAILRARDAGLGRIG